MTGYDTIRLDGHLTYRHFRDGRCIYMEAGRQTITTLGKEWVVDKLQDILVATQQIKFHQTGTDGTVATSADTDLGAALYAPVLGTRQEPSGQVYRSVATVSYTGIHTIAEWGIFTTSSSGVLFARKTLSRPVSIGDMIQFTWDLTVG